MFMAVVTFLFPLGMRIPTAQAQANLTRLSAEYRYWNEGEAMSSSAPAAGGLGGSVVYQKTVFVPSSTMTVYLTISATGDTHFGAGLLLSATYTNASSELPFNPEAGQAESLPTGWLTAQKHFNYDVTYNGGMSGGDGGGGNGDMHDNGIYYTWCVKLGTGAHTFKIRLASTNGQSVFFEKAYFYIDATPLCACMQATNQ